MGSASAVLLPAAYVLATEPEALVAFFTPNPLVSLEDRFYHHLRRAYEAAEAFPNQIVLIATVLDPSDTDFWKTELKQTREYDHGGNTSHDLLKTVCFPDKRDGASDTPLFRQGRLWNTVGMVIPAKTLWALARQCLPEMMNWFDAFLKVLNAINEGRIGPAREEAALVRLYEELFPADFWNDIVKRVTVRIMLLPMEDMDWKDWEHTRRVKKTYARLNFGPLFPDQHLQQVFDRAIATERSSRILPGNQA